MAVLSRLLAGALAATLAGSLSAAEAPKPEQQGQPPPPMPAAAPKGFVPVEAVGVVPTGEGQAVVLQTLDKKTLLPIWIGEAEALSIQLRLDRRRFQRPLTHDLLDDLLKQLGGRMIQVQVDDLKGNTFVGTVVVQQGQRRLEVDARPSDAIALAVGNRVPIYVSQEVLKRVGVAREQQTDRPGQQPDKREDILRGDREEHTL